LSLEQFVGNVKHLSEKELGSAWELADCEYNQREEIFPDMLLSIVFIIRIEDKSKSGEQSAF
jgi:hypothetical protein